jgi:hypothetical protein
LSQNFPSVGKQTDATATRTAALTEKAGSVRILLAMLLFCNAALLAWNAWRHSPTFNEPSHLASGISHWHLGSYAWYSVNPPGVRMIAALPVLPFDPKINLDRILDSPVTRPEYPAGVDFLVSNGPQSLWWIVIARWACIPFSLLGLWICYRWASDLYGACAGLLAATMWCFSPYILGHAALITPDAHAAAVGAAAVYVFWRWLQRPNWSHAAIAGLVLGLAELTKFTLVVFYPLFVGLWLAYRVPQSPGMGFKTWLREMPMLFGLSAISIGVINLGYNFEGTFQRLDEYQFHTMALSGTTTLDEILPEGGNRFAGSWLGLIPIPLPKHYVQGIDVQIVDFEKGSKSYLRGEWAGHGWWYYYLYAMALKMPLGAWCLTGMSVIATIFTRAWSQPWRDELVVLAPFLVLLVFVSSQTGFSAHSRYVIPALPLLFVWTSKVARVFEVRPFAWKPMSMAVLVGACALWMVGSSLAVFPHSLSYFNELAVVVPVQSEMSYPTGVVANEENGGVLSQFKHLLGAGARHGPRHLLGSNVDWSQDLVLLKEWLSRRPNITLDGLDCFGCCPTDLAGIPVTPYPVAWGDRDEYVKNDGVYDDDGPKPGWYALSVNRVFDHNHQYHYFQRFQPIDRIGYSIFIYHITLDDANRVRRELGLTDAPHATARATVR